MQLFGIYTSKFQKGVNTNYVAICADKRDIVHSSDIVDFEDYGKHLGDSVKVEHKGEFFEFECADGYFTEQGKKDFENLLIETIFKDLASS